MSDRIWSQDTKTQGKRWIRMPVTLLPQGAGTPLIGEGDAAGSYFTFTRLAAGSYLLTQKDRFVAPVFRSLSVRSGYTAVFGAIFQNANGTWSVPIFTTTQATTVATVPVTAPGSGYTSAPTVSFAGGAGVGAKAHVVLSGGTVVLSVVDDAGFGYTSAPTASLTGGGGSGATLGTVTLNAAGTAPVDIPAGVGIHVELVMRNSNQVP